LLKGKRGMGKKGWSSNSKWCKSDYCEWEENNKVSYSHAPKKDARKKNKKTRWLLSGGRGEKKSLPGNGEADA